MEEGDGEGADSSEGRIFFFVCRKMLSQAKVDCTHVVESWVRGPHGREDLSHGADVFFHASFVDGLVVGQKDGRTNLVSGYIFRKGIVSRMPWILVGMRSHVQKVSHCFHAVLYLCSKEV